MKVTIRDTKNDFYAGCSPSCNLCGSHISTGSFIFIQPNGLSSLERNFAVCSACGHEIAAASTKLLLINS